MVTTRIFLMGVVILFLGIQLRVVDTFVLNERATKVINSRIKQPAAESGMYTAQSRFDPYLSYAGSPGLESAKRAITPPRWLGWSFCSIGAVLIVTCPCFRN